MGVGFLGCNLGMSSLNNREISYDFFNYYHPLPTKYLVAPNIFDKSTQVDDSIFAVPFHS